MKDMIQRKGKHFSRKLFMMSLILFIVCTSLSITPVQAAEVWSQYGTTGNTGKAVGEFNQPEQMALDGNGNVYVAESNNNRIQKLTVATGVWTVLGGQNRFLYPTGIWVDSSGKILYVAEAGTGANRIQKSIDGGVTWTIVGGSFGSGPGQLYSPKGIVVDKNGNIFVADSANHRIQKITPEGDWTSISMGAWSSPSGMTIDSNGNLYVTLFNQNNVKKSIDGGSTWTTISNGRLNGPSGVAVDSNGNVYVTCSNGHDIQKLTIATGDWTKWGGRGTGPGKFNNPSSVVIDSNGYRMYVADSYNNRIQMLLTTSIPDAPTEVTAAATGSGQAKVSFTPPVRNGGTPITGYTVTSSPEGITATSASSPITVSGLTNGKAYTFTVVAKNAVGDSSSSTASTSVTTNSIPDAPTGVSAMPGNGEAIVNFTPPVRDGGTPITGYTVTANPGGIKVEGVSSPITITGLTNGTAYTFTVVAKNAVGDSSSSDATDSVTPITVPSAPTGVSAAAGNGQATISFTAPANDGGSAITGYTVTSSPEGIKATSASSPIMVLGLTNGTVYTFTVVAENAAGNSAASNGVNATPQVPIPGAPELQPPAAGNTQVELNWNPVEGSTEYKIFKSLTSTTYDTEVATVTGSVYNYNVTGLVNGAAYYFVVKATNAGGDSAASNEVSTIPMTVPGVPTDIAAVAGDRSATISFNAPTDNGGSAITGYEIISSSGDIVATGTSSPISVTGLANGTAYTFTMKAKNSVGSSVLSAVSNGVTPMSPSSGGGGSGGSGGSTPTAPTPTVPTPIVPTEVPPITPTPKPFYNEKVNIDVIKAQVEKANATPAVTFKDVPASASNAKAIELAAKLGIIQGNTDGSFHANATITRAEFATMLVRALGLTSEGDSSFKDTKGHWAADTIARLKASGIINGYVDGTFKPNQTITRAEIVAMLSKVMNTTLVKNDKFKDVSGNWAEAEIDTLSDMGIVKGSTDGSFKPNANATRSESLVMILRMLNASLGYSLDVE